MKIIQIILLAVSLISCGSNKEESKNGNILEIFKLNPIKNIEASSLRVEGQETIFELEISHFDKDKGQLVFKKLSDEEVLRLVEEHAINVSISIDDIVMNEDLKLIDIKLTFLGEEIVLDIKSGEFMMNLKSDDLINFISRVPIAQVEEVSFEDGTKTKYTERYVSIETCTFGKISRGLHNEKIEDAGCDGFRIIEKKKLLKKNPIFNDQSIAFIATTEVFRDNRFFNGAVINKNCSGTDRSIVGYRFENITGKISEYFKTYAGQEILTDKYEVLDSGKETRYTLRENIANEEVLVGYVSGNNCGKYTYLNTPSGKIHNLSERQHSVNYLPEYRVIKEQIRINY